MSSCLQWAARAEHKLPKETALQKKYDFDGEIYDIYHQMGVPGAILSGYNAVDLMLNKIPH